MSDICWICLHFRQIIYLASSQARDATQPMAPCVQEAMRRFGLREDTDPQTYALGIKEVWEVRGLALVEGGF